MDLSDYVDLMRKHARLIVMTTLVSLFVSALVTMLLPRQYEAETQLFVSTPGQDSTSLLQGSSFSQQRVKSYAQALTSPLVLNPVIDELDLDTDAEELSEGMEAIVPIDTVLINLTVTESSPEGAAALANAVSERFAGLVPDLENVSSDQSPIHVTVLSPATPPNSPSSPNAPINLLAGVLFGLVLGMGIALLRHLTDTRVRTEQDVKSLTDTVVVGGLPIFKEDRSPLASLADPHSPRTEAYRALRTNLQFINAAHKTRSFVITSSVPGEGKSTTAANLAVTLGESGARVCVVEADLRRPRLLQYLGLVEGVGLTTLILDQADYEDVMQPLGQSNVVVIGAGAIPPNPSELLGSPAVGEIVKDLEEAFDYVIFDAPPLLPVTDAAVLSRHVKGVLVVVGAGVVRKEQVRKTLELLENVGADILGLILNRLPAMGNDSYSYYRDGYRPDPVDDPDAPRTTHKRRVLNR